MKRIKLSFLSIVLLLSTINTTRTMELTNDSAMQLLEQSAPYIATAIGAGAGVAMNVVHSKVAAYLINKSQKDNPKDKQLLVSDLFVMTATAGLGIAGHQLLNRSGIECHGSDAICTLLASNVANSFLKTFQYTGGTIPALVLAYSGIKKATNSLFITPLARAFGYAYNDKDILNNVREILEEQEKQTQE